MDRVTKAIRNRIEERGEEIATVAQRASMKPDELIRALDGERSLKAEEFLRLCQALGLDLEDFKETA